MHRNWQPSSNFVSRLEIVLLSNSKLFFVLSQIFDKSKIYLNVGYLISLRSAINFKHLGSSMGHQHCYVILI